MLPYRHVLSSFVPEEHNPKYYLVGVVVGYYMVDGCCLV